MSNNNFPKTGIHKYVTDVIGELPDLTGKIVLDIPCGDGRASYEFQKKGATIIALDLFPEFLNIKNLQAEYADLSEKLPLDDEFIDYIICQEGIEHIPNQLNMLQEFNRVLKKDGVALITTPNNSHFRAKLSHFLLETDFYKRMPPTEIDSVWFADNSSDDSKLYFGHLFLLGVQHFQSLLTLSGFEVTNRFKTKFGSTSLILGVFLYPIFLLLSPITYLLYRKKNRHISQKLKDKILWDRVKLNLYPSTLFCKHIFWEVRKIDNMEMTIKHLKNIQRENKHSDD